MFPLNPCFISQRCNQGVLAIIDTLRTWVLLQQDVEVSYANKHKVVYFLNVVSELGSIHYHNFDVATVKQLWEALFSTYPCMCLVSQKESEYSTGAITVTVWILWKVNVCKVHLPVPQQTEILISSVFWMECLVVSATKELQTALATFHPGFAESKLKDLTAPMVNFNGICSDNSQDSIAGPASLWCHTGQHLGSGSLPRPLTDLELSLAMTQAELRQGHLPQHLSLELSTTIQGCFKHWLQVKNKTINWKPLCWTIMGWSLMLQE